MYAKSDQYYKPKTSVEFYIFAHKSDDEGNDHKRKGHPDKHGRKPPKSFSQGIQIAVFKIQRIIEHKTQNQKKCYCQIEFGIKVFSLKLPYVFENLFHTKLKYMCLIVIGLDVHPKYKLILSANRDEFYNRPTAEANYWKDHTDILGGRDLQAGGTWMAISRRGKFGAVTNYRDLSNIKADARSRGDIATNFITGQSSAHEYLKSLLPLDQQYNGYNVLVGSADELYHYSNYQHKINLIKPGIHALSNALLNSTWPKSEKAKSKLEEVIKTDFSHEDLLNLMSDTSIAADSDLPDTGIGLERERLLSPMCIRMENYGTCSTTAITVDRNDNVKFTEKTHAVANRKVQVLSYSFKINNFDN